jgi:hypothetical protein
MPYIPRAWLRCLAPRRENLPYSVKAPTAPARKDPARSAAEPAAAGPKCTSQLGHERHGLDELVERRAPYVPHRSVRHAQSRRVVTGSARPGERRGLAGQGADHTLVTSRCSQAGHAPISRLTSADRPC